MKFNTLPILLAVTFLSTSAVAQTVPTINTDYLNSLTGEKVTWQEVTASGEDTVQIGDKFYKYTYHKPENYTEISERIDDTLSTSDVTDVVFMEISSDSNSGAIFNKKDNSSVSINADFVGNSYNGINDSSYSRGHGAGAIYNFLGNSIGNINGDFVKNHSNAFGGAIFNGMARYSQDTIIGNITGNFIENTSNQRGGAISNFGIRKVVIGNIIGNFIANVSYAGGGAIHNELGTIGNITGYFVRNSSETAEGGAIFISGFTGDIKGYFIENHAATFGGAIYISNSSLGDITADFIGNHAGSGGAIHMLNKGFRSITGNFIKNHARNVGGAISFVSVNSSLQSHITGNFVENYVFGPGITRGGALFFQNVGIIEAVVFGSFFNNYAKSTEMALGGAVYAPNQTFKTGGVINSFSGNYTEDKRGKIYNAIHVDSRENDNSSMTFDTTGGGAWIINDNIEGGMDYNSSVSYANNSYKLYFIGDDTVDTELGTTTQYINMNNAIVNAGDVKVENTTLRFGAYQHEDTTAKNWDGKGKFIASLNSDGTENLDADSVTSLTLNNAVFDISNGYMETVNLKNYSATDSFVHLDVDVENMTSDIINVKGDVDGVTKLVIHATSDKDIRGQGQILFAESFGDTKGGETSFEVARVYKSPFMYKVIYEGVENTSTTTASKDNKWSLEMNNEENKVEDDAPVEPNVVSAPEVIAGIGLHTAGIEQTRTVVRNVSGKVANARSYCPNCGIISDAWNGKQLNNGWVLAQGEYSNIDKQIDMEAKIWGVEGGFDMQSDMNNTFGIFASYRNGEYDLSGKGTRYRSNIGSEIEIDSYLAGLYYRYDKNMNWLFATVYGGTQDAEAKTDDGIASFETDGLEFGASAEIGHSFALNRTTTLSPSLGVYYTQINYDDANDNVGKKYQWDDIKHLEAELGLSLAKNFENGKVYVKPSVIQTLTEDDKVSITGLNEADTYHDQTLGRVEVGGNYGFNDNWSAYGWANYTFGSSYDATSLGVGISYNW